MTCTSWTPRQLLCVEKARYRSWGSTSPGPAISDGPFQESGSELTSENSEMSVEDVYVETDERMKKAVGALEHQLRTIRTGRASAALVDHIRVEYYETETPPGQIANIATPDPQMIMIRPFDPTCLKA